MRNQILAITRKELSSYFGSPLAVIFIGAFLAAVLFVFFTVDTFFARGLADVRPLFRWMPILLILLLAALTMRQWSEEQRSGTQELLLTLPVPLPALVLGKFLAVMALIGLALALTLPLPITVALIGDLDWGPVIGGYLAALLMAGAYAAIGLFVSSRTDSQIVALIATALLGGLFYIVGARPVTGLFEGSLSELLRALGTGSRFESIQRGVIDLRDLVYYLSLTALFLLLNTISLDGMRWSRQQTAYRRRIWITAGLIAVNLLALNLWLAPLRGLRLDLTQDRAYTLSDTTRDLIGNLPEPLVLRAYISERTHPLLAPLAPKVRDLLDEYRVAGNGRVQVSVLDPIDDPELEAEANQTYGIRPTPLPVQGRYESSVISAYFDILVRYGDQDVVLNFDDLIELRPSGSGGVDVGFRNLEYDLTRSIKKVVFGFQSIDAVLDALPAPARLTLFITSSTLPEALQTLPQETAAVAQALAGSGRLQYQLVDLDAPDSPFPFDYLSQTYGIPIIPTSIFSSRGFYAHMLLEVGDNVQLIYPPAEVSAAGVRGAIEAALKRSTTGFLKVVGLVLPQAADPALGGGSLLTEFAQLRDQLGREYTVQTADLRGGPVPDEIAVLLVLAPNTLSERELFNLDQFLMRGGAVVIADGGYSLIPDQFTGGLALTPIPNEQLTTWLAAQGIARSSQIVMDRQNLPFPTVVQRNVGGIQVQEVQAVNYPFFVDLRSDGMAARNPIVSSLPSVVLHWTTAVSPTVTADDGRTTVLLQSSPNSWLGSAASINPDFQTYPDDGFPVGAPLERHPLAVARQGPFESYFAANPPATITDTIGILPSSPESSRLIVIGSGAFVEDKLLGLVEQLAQGAALNNLQFMQNVVDWSVEDTDLLAIRARGGSTRLLEPLSIGRQSTYEIGNYVVALLALVAVYVVRRTQSSRARPLDLLPRAAAPTAPDAPPPSAD